MSKRKPVRNRPGTNTRVPDLGHRAASWRRYVGLGALAAVAFAATFAIVKAANRPTPPPDMVWVPGGEFTMGTDSELGWADEKPAHRVRVDPFWMDEHEVTNAQFRQFADATGYVTT